MREEEAMKSKKGQVQADMGLRITPLLFPSSSAGPTEKGKVLSMNGACLNCQRIAPFTSPGP